MTFSYGEKQFLSAASTSVIVPSSSRVPIADLLQENGDNTLQDIRQRDTLFFDEWLKLCMVLHVPQCAEDELKSYLSRLELKIEIWATSNSQITERSSASATTIRDLLSTDSVRRDQDPFVLVSEDEADQSIFLNLIWEIQVFLPRPRTRIQDAQIAFVPIALVSSEEQESSEESYLEPFRPQVDNLFEPLRAAYKYESNAPYLPLSRLNAVLPVPPKDDHAFHIRSITSSPIPIHSAFVTRFRYTKPSHDSGLLSIIASLDIEVIPFLHIRGKVTAAEVTLHKGVATSLLANLLPIDFQSRDCITVLYKLQQKSELSKELETASVAYVDHLAVSIIVQLELSDGSGPSIETRWTTNVEFIPSINSTPITFGAFTQRSAGSQHIANSNMHHQSDSVSTSLQPLTQYNGPKIIAVSFAASNTLVKVGVPFPWRILVVNRTEKVVKLAIIPLPRIQRPTSQIQQYAKQHAPRSSITSIHPGEKNAGEKTQRNIAQAVIDENVIYAIQHSNATPPETDLMSLTSELRIGPLGPGQCHEDEIKLIAFKSGAFTLDAVRVVDLIREMEQGYGSPGVIMDIKELPDVIVEK